MKYLLLLFLAVNLPFIVFSSPNNDSVRVDPSLGLDLSTRYIWRGMMLDNSAQFQPWAELSYKNFSAGVWGSYAMDGSYAEVDLYVAYQIKNFILTLTDYYTENENNLAEYDFFNFKNDKTNHAIELMASYRFSETIPITFTAGTFLYGFDKDAEGDNYYSTWVALAYDISVGEYDIQFHAGGTPSEGMYSDDAAVTSLGINLTKNIEITEKFSLPLTLDFTVNPTAEDVFLTALISF